MVPDGWLEKKLSDIADYRRGSFPQPYGLEKWFDTCGHPFVQVYDVGKNLRLKAETKTKISDLAAEQSVFATKGTILITLQGSIGRIAITQYSAYVDRTLLVIRDFKIPGDQYYFALSLQVLFEIEKKKAPGGTIKTITKAVLSNFTLPWPPLPEQQKIAKILQTWDRAIATTEKLIDASKQQKKALMQQLLTGKKRFSGFEGEWEEIRLGELCTKITDGAHHSPSTTECGFPMFSVKDMGKTGFKESTARLISEHDYRLLVRQNCKPEINDILIAKDGSILKNCFVVRNAMEGVILSSIALLRPDLLRVYPEYIAHYFSQDFVKTYVAKAFTTGSGVPRIVLKDFKSIKIPMPSIEEQEQISLLLSHLSYQIALAEEKLAHLNQEKKALMQQLLTGKRRVKIDD